MYQLTATASARLEQDSCFVLPIFLIRDLDEKDDKKRISNLEFHINLNSYLSNISSILEVVCREMDEVHERHSKILKNMSNDLDYLQRKYIVRKK